MGYGEPPWCFKGRALYQLQLMKSEDARKYVPAHLKLVELFGYTVGGFFLARYDDSPAGAFDELVVMAGLTWNAPSSCAWAGRVFVNNKDARNHGIHSVGLPSRLAQFTEVADTSASTQKPCWWQPARAENTAPTLVKVSNVDRVKGRSHSLPICFFRLPAWSSATGPRMSLSLPSFSGATDEQPQLLFYKCQVDSNIRMSAPVKLSFADDPCMEDESSLEDLRPILKGKTILTLAFDNMTMSVPQPKRIVSAAPVQTGPRKSPKYALAASTLHGAAVNSGSGTTSSGQNIAVVLATLPWRFGTTL